MFARAIDASASFITARFCDDDGYEFLLLFGAQSIHQTPFHIHYTHLLRLSACVCVCLLCKQLVSTSSRQPEFCETAIIEPKKWQCQRNVVMRHEHLGEGDGDGGNGDSTDSNFTYLAIPELLFLMLLIWPYSSISHGIFRLFCLGCIRVRQLMVQYSHSSFRFQIWYFYCCSVVTWIFLSRLFLLETDFERGWRDIQFMARSTSEYLHQNLPMEYHKQRGISERQRENARGRGWTICLQVHFC